jgi:hypothetical protein
MRYMHEFPRQPVSAGEVLQVGKTTKSLSWKPHEQAAGKIKPFDELQTAGASKANSVPQDRRTSPGSIWVRAWLVDWEPRSPRS